MKENTTLHDGRLVNEFLTSERTYWDLSNRNIRSEDVVPLLQGIAQALETEDSAVCVDLSGNSLSNMKESDFKQAFDAMIGQDLLHVKFSLDVSVSALNKALLHYPGLYRRVSVEPSDDLMLRLRRKYDDWEFRVGDRL